MPTKMTKMPKEVEKKYRLQNYRCEWEKESWAQRWLSVSKHHPGKAYCSFCDKHLVPGKSELIGHTKTSLHFQRAKTCQQNHPISSFAVTRDSTTVKENEEPNESMPDLTSPVKEPVIVSVHKKRPHSREVVEKNEEPQRKKSRKIIMNFYNLQHSEHQSVVLKSLANDEAFMDVTLTSEGKSIKAHKNVLSAMSSYFRKVLGENPCQHPIIVMPRDITFDELKNIITYIYQGEVSVSSREIGSLLKSARVLEVSGLCELAEVEPRDEDAEASPVDEFVEDSCLVVEADTAAETPKLEAKKGKAKRPCKKPRSPRKKKANGAEMQTPHEIKKSEAMCDEDPPDGGTNDDPVLSTSLDSIQFFMCECGSVFMQQTLLDNHKKKKCCGGASKLKNNPPSQKPMTRAVAPPPE